MITRLEIQNYKALKDVALDLTPIHVLIGPNDSGKTSVLEAVEILSAITSDSPQDSTVFQRKPEEFFTFGEQSGSINLLVSINGPQNQDSGPEFHLTLCHSANRWDVKGSLKFGSKRHRRSIPMNRALTPTSKKGFLDSFQESGLTPESPQTMRQARQRAKETARQFLSNLHGIQTYRWIPRHLALPVGLNADRKYRMDESGFGLPTLLDDILSSDRKRFDELERRFQEIFPDVEFISTPTQKGYATAPTNGVEPPSVDGKGLEIKFKHIEKPLSAGSVSDGYLIVLAYLALLHTPQPPPMLLIEEPENGIHPKRLAEIVRMLRSLTEREGGPQILLTTHSPYLLDQFKPEEVTLCTKGEDGTVTTRPLSDSDVVRKESGVFTLGEIWGGNDDASLFPDEAKAGSDE